MGTQENLNKFKIGECHNVGNCTHIGEKQAIPSDVANSGGFKCKYCGAQLHEVQKPKSFFEKYGKIIGIIAAVLVLLGVGFGLYKSCAGSNKSAETEETVGQDEPVTEPVSPQAPQTVYVKQITADSKTLSLKEGKTQKLTLNVVPAQNDEQIIVQNSDGTVASVTETAPCIYEIKALKAGTASISFMADQSGVQEVVTVTVEEEKTELATSGQSTSSGTGTLNLGYAIYKGEKRNGQPHGTGTLTFKSAHLIDSRDPKDRVAEAGDYVSGLFYQGHVETAKWYGADGSLKGSLLLGRP